MTDQDAVSSAAARSRRIPRQRYFVIAGLAVGMIVGFVMHSVVAIAEVAFFAFAVATYLVADAAFHLCVAPTARRALFYALFPVIALAVLAATFIVTGAWAVAVLVALVVGSAIQASVGMLLFPTPRARTTIR
jgi:hypothetical protein